MPILVHHAGALGDFITTLPALRYWKRRRSGERLVLLGKPAFGELVRESGVIDGVLDIDDRRCLPLFYDRFSPEAATLLGPFSQAVIFSDAGSPLVKNIRASEIERIYAQPPFPKQAVPAVDYHLSLFADPAGLSMEERTPRIAVTQEAAEASYAIMPVDHPFITIHSGSGSVKKNWPFERFLELAGMLRQKGNAIIWVRGPAEEGRSFPAGDPVADRLPLTILAGLLSRSRLFVGNDSGITHLAAAVNCPTVALFGPSDPAVWAPRGASVAVVRKITACAPCHRVDERGDACGRECMINIGVGEVVEAIFAAVSPRGILPEKIP